jgi:hypothetical protein
MPASLINTTLNAGGKILRKTTRSTSDDGLVVLVENYTIRQADIGSLEPNAGTTHSSFSSATTKYTRMLVETTAVNPIDGDLADLVVNYVGLDYATGLPAAYITAVGQPGAGVFGADASVVVRYITAQPVFDLLKGASITLNFATVGFTADLTLPSKRFIPASINGTTMPPNPRAKEYRAIIDGGVFREWLYAGYVQTSISFQRRGSFNQIEEQFTEFFTGSSDMFTASGAINLAQVNRIASTGFFF